MQYRQALESDVTDVFSLQLFVAGNDARAQVVERDVRRILRDEIDGETALEVVDVLRHPEKAEAQNISQTPSLVFSDRGIQRRLVGAVDQRDRILQMLDRAPFGLPQKPDGPDCTLADLSPDGMILVDVDGKIVSGNHVGLVMLGLAGRPLRDEVFVLPLAEGETNSVTLANGQHITVQVRATVWRGQPVRLATLRDQQDTNSDGPAHDIEGVAAKNAALQSSVDQAAKAIEAMHESSAELERSNQDLSDFAHRAAHDIVSPLKSLCGAINMVLEDEEEQLSDDGRMLLNIARGGAERVIALTDALISFSRISNINIETSQVNLNTVSRWAQNDLQAELDEADAVCDIDSLPTVVGIPAHFYQVFINLLSNSIKYRRSDAPLKIRVFAENSVGNDDAPCVLIHVEDNGNGFDQAYAERIFQPFQRLVHASEVSGSGIGLATVSKIISFLGGTVSAKGEIGVGARITLRLPL